jgi:FK506-binding nuclear protein
MAGTQPVAVYTMKVPAGDVMVPAVPDFAAMFRLSMAAIDPTAEPVYDLEDEKRIPRATLKLVRLPIESYGDDSDEEDSGEDSEDDDLINQEQVNGGPSNPSKAKKTIKGNVVQSLIGQDSEDDDSEQGLSDAKSALRKLLKGKDKATGEGTSDLDDDDDDDKSELEEVVICTLDPEKVLLHFNKLRKKPTADFSIALPAALGYRGCRKRADLLQGLWYSRSSPDGQLRDSY